MLGWHIVDTLTLKRQFVTDLYEEQKQLSPWGIWNDTFLKAGLSHKKKFANKAATSYFL